MATIKKILSKKPEEDENAPKKIFDASNALSLVMNDKEMKGDIYNDVIAENRLISTGSLLVDSIVKIRSGQVIRLVGKGAELGKTSEGLVIGDNFMKVMDKSKGVFIKAEGRLSNEMKRRSGMKFVDKVEDWTYGTVFVLSCNVFETVATTILNIIKAAYANGEHIWFLLDSLDGLILKADLEKGFADNVKVAGVPLLTKLLFRKLALPIAHYDALLLVTGQFAASPKIDPYAPTSPKQGDSSGGSAIQHQSDYVFDFHPRYVGDLILENEDEKPDRIKNKTLGLYCKVTFRKSASDVTGESVSYPIRKGVIGPAIWREREIIDVMLAYQMLVKGGSWFTISEEIRAEGLEKGIEFPEKVQGMKKVFGFLDENKEAFDFLYEKAKSIILSE